MEDHGQTTDQKDSPLLSAGLQPENRFTKNTIAETHAHVRINLFVCVFVCRYDRTPKGKGRAEVCLTCPLDLTISPLKSTGAIAGFKEIHYFPC